MRLDEERLEALRSWGARLGEASSEEHAAIGRAILMLVDEIDRLHIELWHARMRPSEPEPEPVAPSEATEEEQPVLSSLRARMRQAFSRDEPGEGARPSESDSEAESDAEVTASAQAWIDALRRQQ